MFVASANLFATLALGMLVAGSALLLAPGAALSQEAAGWTPRFRVSIQTGYDDNPFRLSPGQRSRIGDEQAGYQHVHHAYDIVNLLRLRGELRGSGLNGRRLQLGGELDVDAYALNWRRSSATVGVFGVQRLASRDEVGVSFSFTPAEFRSNYLTGSGPSGEPEYGGSMARRLEGTIEYDRPLMRSRRGSPELNVNARLMGERRTHDAVPWRNRSSIGVQLRSDVQLGRRWTALVSGSYLHASHNAQPEPVADAGIVTMTTLDRDFDQVELGGRIGYRIDDGRRILLRHERRTRSYSAEPEPEQVYGGRFDVRHSFGAELHIGMSGPHEVALGGLFQNQTTRRPATGETGDEVDYRRASVFVRFQFQR